MHNDSALAAFDAGGAEEFANSALKAARAIGMNGAQTMRRIVLPQRDIVGRLSRREFDIIDQENARGTPVFRSGAVREYDLSASGGSPSPASSATM